MRAFFVIALGLVVAASVYAAFHSTRPTRASVNVARAAPASETIRSSEPQAGLPNASEELATLRQQVASLGAQVAALHAQASATPVDTGAPPAPSEAEMEAKQREERHAFIADLEARFVDEPREVKWSSAAYSAIHAAFDANGLRDAAASIECRSQTCRVEVMDQGPQTTVMLMRAAQELGPTLPRVDWDQVEDGHGHRSRVLYMSRQLTAGG